MGKKAYLVCGITAETVRQAQAMIAEAVAAEADAALVLTPTTLTRNRIKYVEGFYDAVANSSPLPVYLYSVPSVTAFELPEDLITRLSAHPRIMGIKDSGGHPVRLQRIVAAAPDDFIVFTGSTQTVTLATTAGAYGAISASTNYMPERVKATLEAATRHPVRARTLQHEISRISAAVESYGIPGVKAAAAAIGLHAGHPRLPLRSLSRKESEGLAVLL